MNLIVYSLYILVALITLHISDSLALEKPDQLTISDQPKLMLWAWETPSDMSFIDQSKTGVAYLAGKFLLSGNRIISLPRRPSLKVLPGTYVCKVIRIEVDRKQKPDLVDGLAKNLAEQVVSFIATGPYKEVQIDFDARQNERQFYSALLRNLREELPAHTYLSITSLASWCLGDSWLNEMPTDEVVPMFFSMGRDRQRVLTYLSSGKTLAATSRSLSIGLSIDEPDVVQALAQPNCRISGRRVYLFSTRGWSKNSVKTIVQKFENGGSNWKTLREK